VNTVYLTIEVSLGLTGLGDAKELPAYDAFKSTSTHSDVTRTPATSTWPSVTDSRKGFFFLVLYRCVTFTNHQSCFGVETCVAIGS